MSLNSIGAHYSRLRCDAIFARKPADLKGSINIWEARFLHGRLLERVPEQVVEIGTCAGLSAAVIGDALAVLDAAHGGNRTAISYDNSETCFFDRTKPVGYFLAEAPEEIRARVRVRTGCTALNLADDVAPASLPLLLIDASHSHPWPCLDLWASLPYLREDGEVCFHDVNLPLANPNFPTYGVKYLFDTLILDKRYADPVPGRVSNMGSATLAGNKDQVREQIVDCMQRYPWETAVDRAWLEAAGIFSSIETAWNENQSRRPAR